MIQTTFLKGNGDIIERIRKTLPDYRIGEITSMGWKVLDIKYRYKNKWYSSIEYDRLINAAWTKTKKRIKLKKNLIIFYRQLIYFVALLIMYRVFLLTYSNIM